jgi:biotin-[acetyl-CoA-carboxylase] ligase BirA-like protein
MFIFTDSISFAETLLTPTPYWQFLSNKELQPSHRLIPDLLQTKNVYMAEDPGSPGWKCQIFSKRSLHSQFDYLAQAAARQEAFPTPALCCSGSGQNFHGFKQRPWIAVPGNLHISAMLSPEKKIDQCGVAFTVLSTVSALQVIDGIGGLTGRAQVKWVNDILIDSSKVGGVLTTVQTTGQTVTKAIVGIGLNVLTRPFVEPTPFVPRVGALTDFTRSSTEISLGEVFRLLATTLYTNYGKLLEGEFQSLLNLYRSRSIVIGKPIRLCKDTSDDAVIEINSGIVESICDNLELVFEESSRRHSLGRVLLRDFCDRNQTGSDDTEHHIQRTDSH